MNEATTGTRSEREHGGTVKIAVPGWLAWLGAGALISVGLIGFFTGLILVPFGVALIAWAVGRELPDVPAFLVGLGVGPLLLFRDEWQQYQRHGCIPDTSVNLDQGPDCLGVYVWGYRTGLALVALGVVLVIVMRVFNSRSKPVAVA